MSSLAAVLSDSLKARKFAATGLSSILALGFHIATNANEELRSLYLFSLPSKDGRLPKKGFPQTKIQLHANPMVAHSSTL